MTVPVPKKRSVALLKETILNSAQTSHFEVYIEPNSNIRNWILAKAAAGKGSARTAGLDYYGTNLNLACHRAALPGVSFATHELTNKYHNNTVKNVYRKVYDQTASFTFYVDKKYDLLFFFENWMSFAMNEEEAANNNPKSSFRAKFPVTYKSSVISITKFEKDYLDDVITYKFLDAYPSSIDSMEVSYQGSQTLSCTVGFTFNRYVVGSTNMNTNSEAVANRAQEAKEAQNIGDAATRDRLLGANDIPSSIDAGIA